MAPEDGEKGAAAAPGRLDVIAVAHAHDLRPRQACEAGDSRHANRHRRIHRAETKQNNYRELQQQGGMASRTSTRRMIVDSTRPVSAPASVPRAVPTTRPMATAISAADRECTAP
ncbi:Uncharacterised protein [Klebsiella aerogenes]|nr:Uncharacterised protein [Klebsiella aerogenes]